MEPTTSDDPWYFEFDQTAEWWNRGERVLLFRAACRNRQGEIATAFRADPFTLPIPGRLAGARHTSPGWKEHPATQLAREKYGLEVP